MVHTNSPLHLGTFREISRVVGAPQVASTPLASESRVFHFEAIDAYSADAVDGDAKASGGLSPLL